MDAETQTDHRAILVSIKALSLNLHIFWVVFLPFEVNF